MNIIFKILPTLSPKPLGRGDMGLSGIPHHFIYAPRTQRFTRILRISHRPSTHQQSTGTNGGGRRMQSFLETIDGISPAPE